MARSCFQHRRLVFAGWLLALAALTAVSQAAGISYTTRFNLPDSPSTQALDAQAQDLPSSVANAVIPTGYRSSGANHPRAWRVSERRRAPR